ncbi:MAG: SRPBCC family protein [Pseudomonadota bacterium]|nr:SRPBCC family protein [Pseudomonadota bacterium]
MLPSSGASIRRFVAVAVLLVLVAAGVAFARAQPLSEAHTLARAVRLHHPLDEVWAAVLDLGAQPSWRSDLVAMERQPDVRGHEVWREVPRAGGPVTWETVETLPDRRLVRCVVDQDGPYGGCLTIEIIRRDDGAIVTIAEKFKVHSAFFRYTNTVYGRRARLDTFLTDLGRKFGEPAPRIADLPKDLRDPPKAAAEPVEGAPTEPVEGAPETQPTPLDPVAAGASAEEVGPSGAGPSGAGLSGAGPSPGATGPAGPRQLGPPEAPGNP